MYVYYECYSMHNDEEGGGFLNTIVVMYVYT